MSWVGMYGMGRLSVVIPTCSTTPELAEIALKCAMSYRDHVDELIITEDANVYLKELHDISDRYVLHPNLGYGINTNVGWKLATGDFALVVNSDTEYLDGSLGDLCVAGTITSPQVIEHNWTNANISGACFCVPRNIFDPGGYFGGNENADTELFNRYEYMKVQKLVVKTVRVKHQGGTPGPSMRAGRPQIKVG